MQTEADLPARGECERSLEPLDERNVGLVRDRLFAEPGSLQPDSELEKLLLDRKAERGIQQADRLLSPVHLDARDVVEYDPDLAGGPETRVVQGEPVTPTGGGGFQPDSGAQEARHFQGGGVLGPENTECTGCAGCTDRQDQRDESGYSKLAAHDSLFVPIVPV